MNLTNRLSDGQILQNSYSSQSTPSSPHLSLSYTVFSLTLSPFSPDIPTLFISMRKVLCSFECKGMWVQEKICSTHPWDPETRRQVCNRERLEMVQQPARKALHCHLLSQLRWVAWHGLTLDHSPASLPSAYLGIASRPSHFPSREEVSSPTQKRPLQHVTHHPHSSLLKNGNKNQLSPQRWLRELFGRQYGFYEPQWGGRRRAPSGWCHSAPRQAPL